ncbi:MAG: flagellar hook-associated protein FlgK [Actinomycetota bacterium]
MTSISSFNTPLSALRAQQRVLDVSAHNIANATTPGYRRQSVLLAPAGSGPVSALGQRNGVDVVSVTRNTDDLTVLRASREEAGRAAADASKAALASVEQVFPEPTDMGMANQLHDYWASWTTLSSDPANPAARSAVLAKGDLLVSAMHRSAASLTNISDSAKERLTSLASEANSLLAQVVSFNQQVLSSATPEQLDQRDQVVAQLTKLTGAVTQGTANGQLNVFIGGRQVVAGEFKETLEAPTGVLRFASDSQAVLMTSGEGASVAATINDLVPRYTAALDNVAATLVSSVNTLHAAGYTQAGVTGLNFFDPVGVTASTIALSTDVAGLPANIAAGAPKLPGPVAPGPLDGNQARALAALADSATGADSVYQTMIGGLGVESQSAQQRSNVQATIADAATRDADAVGAVSLDEEMTTIMQAQRAFQAASKVLTTIDELVGYLIDRVGH